MSKHTQGPWHSEKHTNEKTYIYPKSGLNPICEVKENFTNNTDLIESAPELLEALEMVRDLVRDYIMSISSYTEQDAVKFTKLGFVDIAIKKAKGE